MFYIIIKVSYDLEDFSNLNRLLIFDHFLNFARAKHGQKSEITASFEDYEYVYDDDNNVI